MPLRVLPASSREGDAASRLAPPTRMSGAVDTWCALAGRLQAPLETARMRLAGQLGDVGAEARVAFDERGEPLSTWIAVTPASAIASDYHLAVAASETATERLERAFDGEALDVVRQLSHGANEFTVAPARGRRRDRAQDLSTRALGDAAAGAGGALSVTGSLRFRAARSRRTRG